MAQGLSLLLATILLFIGLVQSSPVPAQHDIQKRTSATILGDLTAGATGIINKDDNPARSCKALKDDGYDTSGQYKINPANKRDFVVFCDMSLQGGGFTVIQRRISDAVDFNREWKDYVTGFGPFEGNHWLGLSKINEIADGEEQELYIGLQSFSDEFKKAWYGSFALDEANDYKLTLGAYDTTNSNAGDSFDTHDDAKFSTKDDDNDGSGTHCAQTFESGWWYSSTCHDAHLNGVYYNTASGGATGHGIIWQDFKGNTESLEKVVMAIRPK